MAAVLQCLAMPGKVVYLLGRLDIKLGCCRAVYYWVPIISLGKHLEIPLLEFLSPCLSKDENALDIWKGAVKEASSLSLESYKISAKFEPHFIVKGKLLLSIW